MKAVTSTGSNPLKDLLNFCCRRSKGLTFMDLMLSAALSGGTPTPSSAGPSGRRMADLKVRTTCPTAENGGPDADHRRSLLDGDFEVVAHPHRQVHEHRRVGPAGDQPVAQGRQRPEIGPRRRGRCRS